MYSDQFLNIDQILNYLKNNRIEFCIDSSNLENIYFRNKVRNMLLPFIGKNISGSFQKRIVTVSTGERFGAIPPG